MSDDDDFVRITLRIPKSVHQRLNEAAGRKRSMNAEIISRLETTFEMDDYAPGDNVNHDTLPAGEERFLERIREIIAEEMRRKD